MSWTRCLATLALLALCNCGMVTSSSNTKAGGFNVEGGRGPQGNSEVHNERPSIARAGDMQRASHQSPSYRNARCRYCEN